MVPRKSEEMTITFAEVIESLIDRIQGDSLYGHKQQFDELYDLVDQTVSTGGSNSVLILGPRGVGKSVLVNEVLVRVSKESSSFCTDGLTVKLNGLVETDDKLALKEITRQLNLENVVGEKVFGSFAQHLEFLLASLNADTTGRNSKPIVFVLEEFDLFCNHKNQTLLYNLFDVAQSRAAPIIVIGISSSLDVIECLEKRVKSRFNHRQLTLFPMRKFEDYFEVIKHYLLVPDVGNSVAKKQWNSHVCKLLQANDVYKTLRRLFASNTTIAYLKQCLYAVLCLLEDDKLSSNHLIEVLNDQTTSPECSLLVGLSVLEMCVLISIKHVLYLYEGQSFNFEMAYHEYDKFATRKAKMFRYDRAVVMKAWETLLDLELISPTDKGSKAQKEFRLHSMHVSPEMIMTAVENGLPLPVKEWASSGISD